MPRARVSRSAADCARVGAPANGPDAKQIVATKLGNRIAYSPDAFDTGACLGPGAQVAAQNERLTVSRSRFA
jgi:hypothetical protein